MKTNTGIFNIGMTPIGPQKLPVCPVYCLSYCMKCHNRKQCLPFKSDKVIGGGGCDEAIIITQNPLRIHLSYVDITHIYDVVDSFKEKEGKALDRLSEQEIIEYFKVMLRIITKTFNEKYYVVKYIPQYQKQNINVI